MMYLQVACGFADKWNFQHACGAVDGKHVRIKKPSKSGSLFYNYKGFFSIVLMAMCDADYKFIWVDVGSYGAESDAGVFNRSSLNALIERDGLEFPPPEPLPLTDNAGPDIDYFFISDDAFALKSWNMKPHSKRELLHEEMIFNYRLSRARRVIENAFGIMAHRWRCLLTTMQQHQETVTDIVSATVCLHNLMRTRYPGLQNQDLDREDKDHVLIPGDWRVEGPVLANLQMARHGGGRLNDLAKQQRLYLSQYYCTGPGQVPWQEAHI